LSGALAVAEPSNLRVSDEEREQAAGELREHHLAGRLTSDEFEERLERTYRAATRAQLDELRSDLPMTPATLRAELDRRRGRLRRRLWREASGGAGISAICVGIWAASGADASFWPVWVIIPTMLPSLGNALRLLGRQPDLDSVERDLARRQRRRERRSRRRSGPPELPSS
jgi:Domain of unknown function (DUF1707)